jgi:hypothetical protein
MNRLLSGLDADIRESEGSAQFMDLLWRDVALDEDLAEDVDLALDDDFTADDPGFDD